GILGRSRGSPGGDHRASRCRSVTAASSLSGLLGAGVRKIGNQSNRAGTRLATMDRMGTPGPNAAKASSRGNTHQPIHDEWGIYDPRQAGFEAVLRKLVPTSNEKV